MDVHPGTFRRCAGAKSDRSFTLVGQSLTYGVVTDRRANSTPIGAPLVAGAAGRALASLKVRGYRKGCSYTEGRKGAGSGGKGLARRVIRLGFCVR
jgi:hypothetical protein